MKKFILAIALVLAFSVANADNTTNQKKKGPHPGHVQVTEQMMTQLGLNSTQTAQVKALNEQYSTVFKGPGKGGRKLNGTVNSDKNGNKERPQLTDEQKSKIEAEMKERKAKKTEYQTKLKGILTADQFKTYQSLQAKGKGHGKGEGKKQPKASEE